MLTESLGDLKKVFCMLRLDPACFDPRALTAIAPLCKPGKDSAGEIRRALRRWTLTPQKLPYRPRWIQEDSAADQGRACGTAEECALLRSILHTAAKLRREERLSELSNLADAAHNLPEAMLVGDEGWLCRIRQELEEFCRDHSVTLLRPDTTIDHQEE